MLNGDWQTRFSASQTFGGWGRVRTEILSLHDFIVNAIAHCFQLRRTSSRVGQGTVHS